ncbi:SDR family NAD(P)-dependent oxidoreductase, partial [Mixta calida]
MVDKIALITGGSRGLGRNAALKLAEKGVDVIITWRQGEQEAEAVVAEMQALGRQAAALQLDVADVQSFGDFVARLEETLQSRWQRQRFDYLLNN